MPPAKRAAARKTTPKKATSRREAERRARERRSIKRRLLASLGIVVVLGAVVYFTRADEEATAIDAIEASGSCVYDTDPEQLPPIEGNVEDMEPAQPGFFTVDDEVPNNHALVRSMRQGFVVAWYAVGSSSETTVAVDELMGVSDRIGRDLLVVPRAGLDVPIVVTAWQRRLTCTSFDESAVVRFVEEFRDQGPETGFL